MRVEPLAPDAAAPPAASSSAHANGFAQLIDAAGAQLDRADAAENAFARGTGGMQEMVIERVRADIALQVAAGGAQRAVQALSAVLGMQI